MAKRRFVDLHVKSTLSNGYSTPEQIAKMASYLGYEAIGLADFNLENIDLIDKVKRLFRNYGIDLISRINIDVDSPKELKSILRKIRRKVEIISVFCRNIDVARLAARDRRVDLLIFSVESWKQNFFDSSEAKLALNGESALEVSLMKIIKARSSSYRIKAMRILSENIRIAKKYGVPVVISSGASSILEMRAPRELAALATVFSLSELEARKSLSEVPMMIVNRNREKLSENFIMPGVKLIRRGEIG